MLLHRRLNAKHVFVVFCFCYCVFAASYIYSESTSLRDEVKHIKHHKRVTVSKQSVDYENYGPFVVSWNQKARIQALNVSVL